MVAVNIFLVNLSDKVLISENSFCSRDQLLTAFGCINISLYETWHVVSWPSYWWAITLSQSTHCSPVRGIKSAIMTITLRLATCVTAGFIQIPFSEDWNEDYKPTISQPSWFIKTCIWTGRTQPTFLRHSKQYIVQHVSTIQYGFRLQTITTY